MVSCAVYQLIAQVINLLSVICCNYNLIALVRDCTILHSLLITKICFPLKVSLKQFYSKVYKVILNLLCAYKYHAYLLTEIIFLYVYVTVISM